MPKSKEQRQREARERKRAGLPAQELALQKLVASYGGNVESSQGEIQAGVDALAKRYVECGHSEAEAIGMANAVADGSTRSAWLSPLPKQLVNKEAKQISSPEEALAVVRAAPGGAWGVLLEPHPYIAAIKMTVGVPFAARSHTVHMSILCIDGLIRSFQEAGLIATKARGEFEEWARGLEHPLLVADDAVAALITMDTDYSILVSSESATCDMTSWYPVSIDQADKVTSCLEAAGVQVLRSQERYRAACDGAA